MKLIARVTLDLEAKNPNNAYFSGQTKSKKTGKNRAIMFMKKEYKDYKKEWVEEAKRIMGDKEPSSGHILAKSYWTFGTRRKKDLQNCGKLEYDSLNGIVYDDDSQIVLEEKYKIYKKNKPSITIELYEISDYEDWI